MSKKIAIIGAGFTGLVAAYELSKLGYELTIYEKSSDIGGLAGGFKIYEHSLEKAYHHLFVTDTDILSLIEELGLKSELMWFNSNVAMVKKQQHGFAIYPFNGALDLLKYKPLPLKDRIRAGLVTLFLQKYKKWEKLKGIQAIKWMGKWAGGWVMNEIWKPLLKGKFSKYADNISMAWLWARIHIRANSRKSFLSKEMLAYPKNGFQSIAEKIIKKIELNLNQKKEQFLHLNTNISKISQNSPNKIDITISEQIQQFDAVISTTPTSILNILCSQLPPSPKIDYLDAITLVFTSPQSLSNSYWHNIIDENSPFLVFLQHTNLVPISWYQNEHVYYIGAYIPKDHIYHSETDENIKSTWLNYLKTVFPQFNKTLIHQSTLFRFSNAQHIVDTNYENKILPYKTSIKGLYISNFSQIFPEDRGTNFSVRDGKRVAQLVHQDLVQ